MTEEKSGPRWSRLEHDERRALILASARQLFSERPYGDVSTAAIAEAAGVTRGLLHHYFGTKRALYLEAVRELVASPGINFIEAVATVDRGTSDSWDWERGVDAWMELTEANKEAWLTAISAGETGKDQAMHEILDRAREQIAAQVIRVLNLDEVDGPEVRSLMRAFARYAEEITREWLEAERLSRAQARLLLVGSLPLLVDELLPKVMDARESAKPGRRRRR